MKSEFRNRNLKLKCVTKAFLPPLIQQYRASSAVGKGGEARTKAGQWQLFGFKQLWLPAWLSPRLSEWVWRAVPDEM